MCKRKLLRQTGAFLVAQMVKNLPAMQETWVRSLGLEDPLEKGLATHSSILAWRIPWTERPGGLLSIESQRVEHSWVINVCAHARTHTHTHNWEIYHSFPVIIHSLFFKWDTRGNLSIYISLWVSNRVRSSIKSSLIWLLAYVFERVLSCQVSP